MSASTQPPAASAHTPTPWHSHFVRGNKKRADQWIVRHTPKGEFTVNIAWCDTEADAAFIVHAANSAPVIPDHKP